MKLEVGKEYVSIDNTPNGADFEFKVLSFNKGVYEIKWRRPLGKGYYTYWRGTLDEWNEYEDEWSTRPKTKLEGALK